MSLWLILWIMLPLMVVLLVVGLTRRTWYTDHNGRTVAVTTTGSHGCPHPSATLTQPSGYVYPNTATYLSTSGAPYPPAPVYYTSGAVIQGSPAQYSQYPGAVYPTGVHGATPANNDTYIAEVHNNAYHKY